MLVDPPGPSLVRVVLSAPERSASWSFSVGGTPIGRLRQAVREQMVGIGLEFARAHGLWPSQGGREADELVAPVRHLVVTGHQPVLAHPGIVVKTVLVAALAQRVPGTVAVNCVVDYDTAVELDAPFPERRQGLLRIGRAALAPVGFGRPFCDVPAPDRLASARFFARLHEAIDTLGPEGGPLRERLRVFEEEVETLQRAVDESRVHSLAEWVTAVRHRWEGRALGEGARYLEVPVGELADGQAFRLFFADMALRAFEFSRLFNRVLHEYRERRHIRSRANPFPDLFVDERRAEVPFWLLTPGERRRKLYVERLREGVRLSTVDGPVMEEAGMPSPEALARKVEARGLAIRPRAIALTMFVRLFAADLFVHGVGGARYDRVTDAVITEWYGVEPPPYAVATLSLALGLEAGYPPGEERALKQTLRAMRFNPQRFVVGDAAGSRVTELVRRKASLVATMHRPGVARRALTREIEAVNRELLAVIAPLVEKTEARLQRARIGELEWQASRYRGYPAFLYEAGALRRAVDEALEGERLLPCARGTVPEGACS